MWNLGFQAVYQWSTNVSTSTTKVTTWGTSAPVSRQTTTSWTTSWTSNWSVQTSLGMSRTTSPTTYWTSYWNTTYTQSTSGLVSYSTSWVVTCPGEDVPIDTPKGSILAGDLKIGDKVIAYNLGLDTYVEEEVIAIEVETAPLFTVELSNGCQGDFTGGHLFLTSNHNWVALRDLPVGSTLFGDISIVNTSNRGVGKAIKISLSGVQNYRALGVISHNVCSVPNSYQRNTSSLVSWNTNWSVQTSLGMSRTTSYTTSWTSNWSVQTSLGKSRTTSWTTSWTSYWSVQTSLGMSRTTSYTTSWTSYWNTNYSIATSIGKSASTTTSWTSYWNTSINTSTTWITQRTTRFYQ